MKTVPAGVMVLTGVALAPEEVVSTEVMLVLEEVVSIGVASMLEEVVSSCCCAIHVTVPPLIYNFSLGCKSQIAVSLRLLLSSGCTTHFRNKLYHQNFIFNVHVRCLLTFIGCLLA